MNRSLHKRCGAGIRNPFGKAGQMSTRSVPHVIDKVLLGEFDVGYIELKPGE